MKYKPNKQYNEISARNTVVVHNNTAYETVENRAEYLECGEFNQASLYECVNSLDQGNITSFSRVRRWKTLCLGDNIYKLMKVKGKETKKKLYNKSINYNHKYL